MGQHEAKSPAGTERNRGEPNTREGVTGRSFAIFGGFTHWPSYHGGTPEEVVERLGGTIRTKVDDELDVLVLGDKRGTGRADAKAKAARILAKHEKAAEKSGERKRDLAPPLELVDEAAFRELVRLDVGGRRFAFFGDFEHCPSGIEEGWLASMVESAGGSVQEAVDEHLDYLVLGNRRAKGKTAAIREAKRLAEAGHPLHVLDEEGFLELVRPESSGEQSLEFPEFLGSLYGVLDRKKIARALKMLKGESFRLYSDVDGERLIGVVRSQTVEGTVYAPWLTAEGRYGCCSQGLDECMGLQGSVCKHLLVLVVGLAGSGELSTAVQAWIHTAASKRPKKDADLCAETLIRYKGAEAGEIDWRPTETIPEDFYAF